ncbi:hypothetical protein E6O75_ATG01714 [Venturia nashicola]|uniref:Uncharacterized protein n=1 Tax=Venturia nashicola TaxID=86259 RepID=A0A4Z1P0N5_9PEZI|nr:hypothetical protein E6O75_ATG01714 [Venturia nashicola]
MMDRGSSESSNSATFTRKQMPTPIQTTYNVPFDLWPRLQLELEQATRNCKQVGIIRSWTRYRLAMLTVLNVFSSIKNNHT